MTKRILYDSLFILIVAAICHLLFSKYGFNPTDEGFVLSATNRVLHAQIPHVDFSSVRPLGYAYLHIPELLISKSHLFLVSRFVFWLEQVWIAFLWIRFLINYTKNEIPFLYKYALTITCFIFNVHYFPCSVLHTIDGLLMCMIGLNVVISKNKWNFIGFFFFGFAALCKQNYLVVLPFALFLFNRKNIVLNFIAGIFPIAFYIGFIGIHHGLQDLMTQLSGHNELLKVGVFAYLFNPMIYIGFIGVFIYQSLKVNRFSVAVITLLMAFILLTTNHFHGKYSFLFFGILLGETIREFVKKEKITISFIALLLAWCVSISIGYNTPSLFIGGIISLLIFSDFNSIKTQSLNRLFYGILIISCITFYFVRTHNIYRDASANKLIYKLDNIVEGANGIYTDKNTFLVLQQLDSLKKSIPNLVVVPDFTACNISHSHQSKILTEWPNKTEIPNEKILQKVTAQIKNDTTLTFAIPIFQTALLKDGFSPQESNGLNYPIVKYVRENFTKKKLTTYFELRKSNHLSFQR